MKILRKNNRFWYTFLFVVMGMYLFYYYFIFGLLSIVTDSTVLQLLPLIPLILASVPIARHLASGSYDAYDLVFDASGVTRYDGKRIVRHHDWSEYKTRCIVSHRGKPEWFHFSHEPLYIGAVLGTQRAYHFGEGKYKGDGFCSSHESIGFPYKPEIYAAFRKSCPDVELLRIDTNGEVYVITDDDREILVARIFHRDKVYSPREEDARNMLEILEAINAVRAAEAAKTKASRKEKVLTPEEMPVFTIYPKKTKNSEEAAVDRWDRENAERKVAEKLWKEEQEWYDIFINRCWREKRPFELIENPVAQKSVMAAAAPEADEPAPAVIPQTEAAAEAEETTADEADFAEDPAAEFPEESAEEELPDRPGSTIRSVEEILASASRTVESVRGLGSRFREEDASAEEAVWSEEAFTEADDAWEEEAFSDEDME